MKTIIELDERSDKPTYHYEDSYTPWFSVDEDNLVKADSDDLERLDVRENWTYFQKKYGFKSTLEQLGGCY